MSAHQQKTDHPHGPENAEHELKKAYNCVMESAVTFSGIGSQISDIQPTEVQALYQEAFKCFRSGDRLGAERWARSTKHLARAFWHEAKAAYLEQHDTDMPFLEGKTDEEYNVHETRPITEDLIESVSSHIPPGCSEMPEDMSRYIARAKKHLGVVTTTKHDLLKSEYLKAAHEYARVVECLALAYAAQAKQTKEAA